MQANVYQELTRTTEIYTSAAKKFISQTRYGYRLPDNVNIVSPEQLWLSMAYCTGKLNGEAGEIAELVFKALRDGEDTVGEFDGARRQLLFKELGDVMWYVARLADLMGFKLEDIMTANIDKLMDREYRGVLTGDGDER